MSAKRSKVTASTICMDTGIRHNKDGQHPLDRDGWLDIGGLNYEKAAVNRIRVGKPTKWWATYEDDHPLYDILTKPDSDDTMKE